MRLVFVSSMHPACGLVGGVRLFRFAQELAVRGHQVILLCSDGPVHGPVVVPLRETLASHDWAEPLVMASGPLDQPVSGLPASMRKAGTALRLLCQGGPYPRWRRSALSFAPVIIDAFKPQLCYATFDCLDSLAIGRSIAVRAGVPWVMDIKDPATEFIRAPLRPWLMRRFKDAAAVTLNSEFQRTRNPGWTDADSTVIYSGVEPVPCASPEVSKSSVALVGSVYDQRQLEVALRGFSAWRERNDGKGDLHYFGVEADTVMQAVTSLATDGVVIEGQVQRQEFLRRCSGMSAVMYIRTQKTFHHKFLELAALGRPLLVCPGEGEEAAGLATQYGIDLRACPDPDSVATDLASASATPSRDMSNLSAAFGWSSVTSQLEQVMLGVLDAQEQPKP